MLNDAVAGLDQAQHAADTPQLISEALIVTDPTLRILT